MVPRDAQAAAMMPIPRRRPRAPVALALCVAIAGCATAPSPPPPTTPGPSTWAGRVIGTPPAPNPVLRQSLINHANQEWEFFGRQRVVFKDGAESIPLVGAWEDDDASYSNRVNAYWRAVGKPRLDGMDCHRPWSAAFVSWVMEQAGVPEDQFPPTPAHGVYLAQIIQRSDMPGRYFVPRRVADYSPNPGDLICASRGTSRAGTFDEHTGPDVLVRANVHCDLVVQKTDTVLEAIGGNVRNSVSRSTLELDGDGRLQVIPRRPWFLILQNRL